MDEIINGEPLIDRIICRRHHGNAPDVCRAYDKGQEGQEGWRVRDRILLVGTYVHLFPLLDTQCNYKDYP